MTFDMPSITFNKVDGTGSPPVVTTYVLGEKEVVTYLLQKP